MAFAIFKDIFDSRNKNDKGERKQDGRLSIRDRNGFDHLHDHDNEEVNVGCFTELYHQVLRQKVVPLVLGCLDRVILDDSTI